MNKFLNADALLKMLRESDYYDEELIENFPDGIIRCENCIHGAQRTLSNDVICPYMTRLMSPSDFCSHGAIQ